ncbi:hypothetical protein EVAR_25406_1 [Eumeta japonica]|uniref:Uncharacterized protein n=1 Tax=Eumeta variegata TaxID=151549 RepID=A0A4C1V7T7_EUMVA|nr:hypothetical protein EVAR_25406_1 [Eumeta japonica]
MEQPHKKRTYWDTVSVVKFTDICSKTAFSEHAALSTWATMALPRVHATKTQTGPLEIFANLLAIRSTTWVAHEHIKGKLYQKLLTIIKKSPPLTQAAPSARARCFR